MTTRQRSDRFANELRDFGFGVMRFQVEQLRAERPLTLRSMPANHCSVPGDWHEREFVKAMLEDGLLRQAEDELDRKENQVGHD